MQSTASEYPNMWYVETKRFDGKWFPSIHTEYPSERTADGRFIEYRLRRIIEPEHRDLPFQQICGIYGKQE